MESLYESFLVSSRATSLLTTNSFQRATLSFERDSRRSPRTMRISVFPGLRGISRCEAGGIYDQFGPHSALSSVGDSGESKGGS
ncbi:Uncharacterized protein FKW44_019977 [Caligus rogercresseyi]|uniref:Uncharacterized protein n=1 Tax=Caligus rogercresseyi TaxID=217165 RepID=A0A7T8GXC7_CALRO|nr:Uncharacterized protein FKW44_019977 [Caligus rogercresseyi]